MSYLAGAILSATYTSAQWATSGKSFSPGTRMTDKSGQEWVFVQASGSLTAYDAVKIQANYRAGQITIDTAKEAVEVGFAQVAFGVDEYGWVMVNGRPLIRLAADADKDLALYCTTTGGVLDDATTSSMIQGVVCTTSVTGATTAATCVARFPTISRSSNLTSI